MKYLKQQTKGYKEQTKGYSLVEMVIVLAIMAILTGILIPVLSQYLPGVQLNGSARDITADLRDAEQRAITEQDQYILRFQISPPSYQVIHKKNNTEEVIRAKTLPSNISLTLDPFITSNQIIFSPDGGPSASGNITLGLNNVTKIINVSPAGFIKINQ